MRTPNWLLNFFRPKNSTYLPTPRICARCEMPIKRTGEPWSANAWDDKQPRHWNCPTLEMNDTAQDADSTQHEAVEANAGQAQAVEAANVEDGDSLDEGCDGRTPEVGLGAGRAEVREVWQVSDAR